MAKKISGSEIVIECLKEQGVDIVFGYPGGVANMGHIDFWTDCLIPFWQSVIT